LKYKFNNKIIIFEMESIRSSQSTSQCGKTGTTPQIPVQQKPIVYIPPPACSCRKKQGFSTGWCGVAGGGVPACDH
jgi:hypothetical protein